MGKVTGFIEWKRDKQPYRPVEERIARLARGLCCHGRSRPCASRARAAWTAASRSAIRAARSATSSRTGTTSSTGTSGARPSTACTPPTTSRSSPARLCPAPCEGSCVLGINDDPVTIKQVELAIIDRAFDGGLDRARAARRRGPARPSRWSAPAPPASPPPSSSRRAGHQVTVFERADRIGGLLRYGIPEFKMEKRVLDRRLAQMEAEGVRFVAGAHVGVDRAGGGAATRVRRHRALRRRRAPRVTCRFPGGSSAACTSRWTISRRRTGAARATWCPTRPSSAPRASAWSSSAAATPGADCLGTVHRQGARSRSTSSRSCRARRTRAPPTTRGRSGRTSTASPPPTRRAASASTRSPPRASSATSAGA